MHAFYKSLSGVLVGLALNVQGMAMEAPDAAQASTDRQVFNAAYFEKYVPRTALDMVARIPGFQINSNGGGKRGLGQGGANVLINNERISGKTNAQDQLSRINASSVLRIEIIDGTTLDIPGLSGAVANVVTKNTALSGNWEWRGEFRKHLAANVLGGKLTLSGERDKLSWSLSASNNPFRNGHRGPEYQTDPDGRVFEIRDEDARYYGDNPGLALDLGFKPKDGHIANLNLKYNLFNFNSQERSHATALLSDGVSRDTLFSRAEDEYNYTIDSDYEFPFLKQAENGKLKLIGYYRFEHSPTVSRFDIYDPGLGHTDGSRFFRIADEAELIGRAEYSWKPGDNRDWQLAAEGVYNWLDIQSRFLDFDGQAYVDEAIDGANSRVEEARYEATLTHSRKLSDKWSLQSSIGAEYSDLSQNTGLARTFFRPKGYIQTSYKPNDSLDITARIEREVGQLNFFDFISSLSLNDDLNTVGNVNLVPEQSWLGELVFDKDFGDGNRFKLTLYGALISDLVDRIPIGDDGDAVGNIDSAYRYGVDLNGTIKGDKWGLKGTQLDLVLQLRNSLVTDPVSLFDRRLNNDKISYWSAQFRHDIENTNWAWGFFTDQFINAPSYRLTTINAPKFNGPWGSVFIEHKDVMGMKVKFSLANVFQASDDFQRQVFTDRRDRGVLLRTETRSRDFDIFARLNVSGTF